MRGGGSKPCPSGCTCGRHRGHTLNRGKTPWNKGLKTGPAWNRGRPHPPETRARISAAKRGKPLGRWSDEEVLRRAADGDASLLHRRLVERHPKTGICAHCGAEGQTDWCYLRHPEPHTLDIADYFETCKVCHKKMDQFDRAVRALGIEVVRSA
jgi:NUMOD3 motif